MSEELSSFYDTTDCRKKIDDIKKYLEDRVQEIKTGIQSPSRSVFDFLNMTAIVGALATLFHNASENKDGAKFLDYLSQHLFSVPLTTRPCVCTAFYYLVRCGLVHTLVPAPHHASSNSLEPIGDYQVCITHDHPNEEQKTQSRGTTLLGYFIDSKSKRIIFFADELVKNIHNSLHKCFDSIEFNGWELIFRCNGREVSGFHQRVLNARLLNVQQI